MKLLKTLAFVCLCVPMWGQGYRYDSNAFTSANNVPPGSQSTLFTIPFAKITVCAYPDNGGQPCTNTVPIYQDPALTVTAQNPITADVHGRFGFWKAAGFYTFSVVSPGGEFLGTYIISLGGAGGETTVALTTNGISGPSTLTGNPAAGYLLNVPDYQTTAFETQVIPPIGGQFVVVYPTTGTITSDPVGNGVIGPQGGHFEWNCSGILCTIVATTNARWSGFVLPDYVNPANVTAVYADGVSSASELLGAMPSGGANQSKLSCTGMVGTDTLFPSYGTPTTPWSLFEGTIHTTLTGAQVATATCSLQLGPSNSNNSGMAVNLPALRLLVYYSGPAPPVRTAIDVVPPLAYNPSALTLSDDAVQVDSINGVPGAFTFTGSGVSCTTTTCTFSAGAGTITGSGTTNYYSLWTGTTALGNGHLDDGVTTAATITSSEPIAVAGSTHGISIPAGTAVAGAAGKVVYASDATSGFAEVNENNTGLSRVCTAANGICAGGSPFITSLTTTGSSGAATVSSGVLNVPIYTGGSGGQPGFCTTSQGNQICLTDSTYNASNQGATTTTVSGTWTAGTSGSVASCSTFSANQGVFIAGAGAAAANYIGTVVSCSGTTLTVTPATSTTVSASNAVQHDETAAFNAAITFLGTNGSGNIWLNDGKYLVNGPLQDTGGANAILPMPHILYASGVVQQVVIGIRGFVRSANFPTTSGVIIQTAANAGNLIGAYYSTGPLPNFTNVLVDIENLHLRAPANPSITLANLYWAAGAYLDNVYFETGADGSSPLPTTGTGSGLVMPSLGNSSFSTANDLHLGGFATCVRAFEHMTSNDINEASCVNGLMPDSVTGAPVFAGNAIHIDHFFCQQCTNQLQGGANKATLQIDAMDIETATSHGINDPSNLIYGTINFNVQASAGAVTPTNPAVNGASNLCIRNLQFPNGTTYGGACPVVANVPSSTPVVASTGTALAAATTTGTGSTVVLSASPVLTGTPDASGAAQFRLPVATSFATLANGEIGYDSTNKNWHTWVNGADTLLIPLASGFVSGDCGQPTSTAGSWKIVDAGGACGVAGGGSAFSALTSGSNTTATMTVGTGASLQPTGTGAIGATAIGGVTVTGTPSTGYVPTATSPTTATWQAQSGASSAPTFFPYTFTGEITGTATTTPSVSVTAGQLLVVSCRFSTGSTGVATDSAGDTFTALTAQLNGGVGTDIQVSWAIASTTASTTFTCTQGSSAGGLSIIAMRFSATGTTANTSAGSTAASSANFQSPAFTTTQRTLNIFCVAIASGSAGFTPGVILGTPSALIGQGNASLSGTTSQGCEANVVAYGVQGAANMTYGAAAATAYSVLAFNY